ncbi:rab GTPase-binding effector protein 1-like protein [Sarcoptes scabiei]|uniref:Rab GTPase-binding effector protein 1-like protein n=1 Tax=Sarcoptes scabiei TaxID=52283 RepID=A0A132AFP9_SARSC|nr:rab GTPase-binding effector protein 1-like protein [Sarcoptes scabiei]
MSESLATVDSIVPDELITAQSKNKIPDKSSQKCLESENESSDGTKNRPSNDSEEAFQTIQIESSCSSFSSSDAEAKISLPFNSQGPMGSKLLIDSSSNQESINHSSTNTIKQNELEKSNLNNSGQRKNMMACEMCNNYEMQLQDMQYREAVLHISIGQYEKNIVKLKEDLKKEQSFENELKSLSSQVDQGQNSFEKISNKFAKLNKSANSSIASLINQIDKLKSDIVRLSSDNEKLIGRHLKKSREMLSESISLPEDPEALQFYCLQLREDLIQALYNREHLEETLRSENIFLKEQLLGEQQSKENIEENLAHENKTLLVRTQNLESELKNYKKNFDQIKIESKMFQNNYEDLSRSSSQKIEELETKLQILSDNKAKSAEEIASLRSKVQSLQIDLDNSEQVQRDFVKLSQSLQVQLEKIRQSDTEVRWQHEDDVTECNGCKKCFHSRKEKINCMHCGRIFCSDCCSKSIQSGPNKRLFKVCQVCHTLLDHQTACWFVNEVPLSPT